ncbi:hypothetical protein Tco_0651695 [Tanacetum coccineum]|uniref:Aminotransferase-like plant mobile domain-containing protein n=1 Tax=Tanacetum coccineum TaxID=301880 RepID=A0ABQ4WW60_9ASTR
MDNPNITMEEYIRLEEEKARRHGQTFNWQTATYSKMKYCINEDDSFTNLEIEYPAIVFDNTSDATLSCEPTNDKVNMPSSPSPEPTIGYIDDLDFFKDFKNKFPTIAYNDLKSKSDPLVEPSVSSQHIDKFETSLSEYDEEEQNVLYFNDSFPLDVIFHYNLKTIKDNDDNIDITQPSRTGIILTTGCHQISSKIDMRHLASRSSLSGIIRMVLTHEYYGIQDMAPLPHHDLRHPWLRYQTLEDRLSMIYTRDDGQTLFTSHVWRRLFEIREPLVREFMMEFFSTCRMSDTKMGLDEEMAEAGFGAYWQGSERVILDKGDLRDYWMEISFDRDFLGPAPSYVFIQDPVRRLCHKMIACNISGRGQEPEKVTGVDLFYLRSMDRGTANVPYLLAQYLFRHAEGRKSGARLSEGYFIGRLAAHFGLVSDQGLRGLSVVASELPLIDLHEFGRLNIYLRVGNTWAWLAPGLERQQAGGPGAAEDAPVVDEGAQAVPAPIQAPQPLPPAPQHRTMTQRIERLEEEMRKLQQSVIGLRGVVKSSITEQTRVSTWMISCMTQIMDASGHTYQAFDSTLFGSSRVSY